MRWSFRDAPIKQKLMALVAVTSAVSAITAASVVLAYRVVNLKRQGIAELRFSVLPTLTRVEEVLAFGTPEVLEKTLQDLVTSKAIYGRHIRYARVAMPDWAGDRQYPNDVATLKALNEELQQIPRLKPFLDENVRAAEGYAISGGTMYFYVKLPVLTDVGSLNVLARAKLLSAADVMLVGLVFLACFTLGLLLSRTIQRSISGPIQELAHAAQSVTVRDDFCVGVKKRGNDEIGKLVDSFTEMLKAIGARETQLREAMGSAEASNRSKSVFLANVSHELRTPLTSIIGFAHLQVKAGRQRLDPDVAFSDFKRILRLGNRLRRLIDQVLDLATVEAGKMEMHVTEFNVRDSVVDVMEWMTQQIEGNGNESVVDIADEISFFTGDRAKFEQIIINLLGNARKFTQNGKVTLTIRTAKGAAGGLEIAVTDTGIGIEPEKMARLFESFSTDAATASQYGGTGLGLTISRHFARLMGGNIVAESELGRGSTFTVTIPPATLPAARQVVAPAKPIIAAPPRGGKLMLVVDDDPSIRELVKRIVVKDGFEVITAANGEEGLRLAAERRPDVIVLDVVMPGMNGWAVLTTLKADSTLSDIPVILFTVLDDENRAYALGASDFLVKPVPPERLRAVARKYRNDGQSSTVLVIDDQEDSRRIARRMLESERWTVHEASDGRAALSWLDTNQAALILLDLLMPEMDGFTFVEEMRARTDRNVPIIVVTSKTLSLAERERLRGGVDAIFQKGTYTTEQIDRTIRTLVR